MGCYKFPPAFRACMHCCWTSAKGMSRRGESDRARRAGGPPAGIGATARLSFGTPPSPFATFKNAIKYGRVKLIQGRASPRRQCWSSPSGWVEAPRFSACCVAWSCGRSSCRIPKSWCGCTSGRRGPRRAGRFRGSTSPLSSPPAACGGGRARADVFARGPRGDLLHSFWNGRDWSAFESLGMAPAEVSFSGAAAACTWGKYRLDVFACAADGKLYNASWR